jgi:hypothetical protein
MLDTVMIQDRNDVFHITFDDIRKYHGLANIAGAAIGFKAIQAAASILTPDAPLPREPLSILTGHPGPGVKDAIEFLTRAPTQGAYFVDRNIADARWNPYANLSFGFFITLEEQTAAVYLKDKVLPDRFFELMKEASQTTAPEVHAALDALKQELSEELVGQTSQQLFDIQLR